MDWEEGKKYEKKGIEKALAYMREHPLTHEEAVEQAQRLKEKAENMTRKEAIDIVMSATVWTDEEREALGVLIPELAESDDERIRKTLYDRQEESDSIVSSCNEKIAYLEKMKEPDNQ